MYQHSLVGFPLKKGWMPFLSLCRSGDPTIVLMSTAAISSCGPQHSTTTLREPCASQNLSVDGVNYVMGVVYSDKSGNCRGSNPMMAQRYLKRIVGDVERPGEYIRRPQASRW